MRRSRTALLSETISAIDELREWLEGSRGSPPEYVSKADLLGCLKAMFEIELNLRAARLPENVFRNSGMGRMIVDHWPSDFPLANRLLEIEQSYAKLEESPASA